MESRLALETTKIFHWFAMNNDLLQILLDSAYLKAVLG